MSNPQPGSFIQTFPLPVRPMTSGCYVSDSSGPAAGMSTANPYQSLVNTFGARTEGPATVQTIPLEKGVSYASLKCTTNQPAEESYFDITSDRDSWPSPSTRSAAAGQSLGVNVPQAVQDIGQYGPVGLCIVGRDVTREVLHRVIDVCSLLKVANLSVSNETMKQQQEKLGRAQESLRQAVLMANRLGSIIASIENFQQQRLPANCDNNIQELIPYVGKRNPKLEAIREEAMSRSEYKAVYAQYINTKQQLEEVMNMLKENIAFLRNMGWSISSLLN
ncbi:hypothetical protein M514_07497 [Trichuris suis]|uniref:Mediator of RNA polymerase II transcription subunit 30 n=1 Tax=Trichuris suis TaxID=68888 RepID=A0A085M322_9BILA|nr:hypothetical protein M513_07497 [Trichuris suis]KFD67756.1 hypothetical protein M514_07497 [Trichuris suis]KHJ41245.1 hypothetical protein D918_08697 [Trichuris suis]